MAHGGGGQSFLIGLFLTTLVLGALVILFKPDYRIDQILITNEDYYPNFQVNADTEEDESRETTGGE